MRLLSWLFGSSYTATVCDHKTNQSGKVSAFGRTITTKMPLNNSGSVDYCLDCISKMAIQCAWCGDPIFVCDPVTLYTPSAKDFKIPEHAVVHSRDPLQLVGCLGWNCAMSGADRAGFWVPGENGKGKVQRVPSPLEIALGTGKEVIVGDVGDMAEAHRLASGG